MAKAKTPRITKENAPNNQVITMPEVGSVPVRKLSPMSNSTVDLASQIRERAYELYKERGSTPGHENEDWLSAEREVLARQNRQQRA
jgi:hypothetical protein